MKPYDLNPGLYDVAVSEQEVRHMMRLNRISIRQAAQLFSISLKRVREIRASGCPAGIYAWEWMVWLPESHRAAEANRCLPSRLPGLSSPWTDRIR